MKTGVFGGTFDPLHIGHLILAEEAQAQLRLDRVLWVLTQYPPHKKQQAITPVELRLQMVQAAIQDNPSFALSRVDIDRLPPHYAIDTLRLLTQAFPNTEWIYLMGEDSLRDLPTWHTPHELVAICAGFGVMKRPNNPLDLDALEDKLPGVTNKIQWIDAPLIDISASGIRRRICQGEPFQYFLPPEVYRIIQEHQLYRSAECRSQPSKH